MSECFSGWAQGAKQSQQVQSGGFQEWAEVVGEGQWSDTFTSAYPEALYNCAESKRGAPGMPKRTAIVDVLVVVGVSLMYATFEVLRVAKRLSFLAVGIALVIYALFVVHRRSDSWTDLGFRTDNLRAALLPFRAATLAAGFCLVAWAMIRGRAYRGREILILLALYPAWAVVQQVAFQGLLHRRLMVLLRSSVLQILITATAFAARSALVAAYRRWPNMWLLGASHSLLAALAYPLVLGDKPLSRL